MSGHILMVEGAGNRRIVCRADLRAAHYAVTCCADAADVPGALRRARPDLAVLGFGDDIRALIALCRRLRADPARGRMPILVTGDVRHEADRLALLRAGVRDILPADAPQALLLARIRSLLRADAAQAQLHPQEARDIAPGFAPYSSSGMTCGPAPGFAPGLAEEPAGFAAPGRTVVLSPDGSGAALPAITEMMREMPGRCHLLAREADLADADPAPDLVVIDAQAGAGAGQLFRRIADLRASSRTHNAAILAILPPRTPDMAVMALDLGANDVVTAEIGGAELTLRADLLIRRKHEADHLRASVRDGLIAAVTDPLTGLYNRRYAMPQIDRMADRARRNGQDFAVMMLDIDHFKQINDRHGHAAGDAVLVELAARLRDRMRPCDLIARIGGEEFLVAMPATSGEAAAFAAERLRRAVGGRPFDLPEAAAADGPATVMQALSVTLSIGVATLSEETGPRPTEALMMQADTALYRAKSAGRNMVTLHPTAA